MKEISDVSEACKKLKHQYCSGHCRCHCHRRCGLCNKSVGANNKIYRDYGLVVLHLSCEEILRKNDSTN